MTTILLTNDDGVTRIGLWVLYEALEGLADIVVVAPESMRSSTGMSLTFHKALRMRKVLVNGRAASASSGNPADCVFLGVNSVLKGRRPDLVVSGINEGDNTSAQSVYGSGTVAAAIQACIMGIPSSAFSLALPLGVSLRREEFRRRAHVAAKFCRLIVRWMLEEGLPEGVDYLNVNFPDTVSENTKVSITRTAQRRYLGYVTERRDPRGRPYFWQWGRPCAVEELKPGTDVYAVTVEKRIAISPMRVDSSAKPNESGFGSLLNALERISRHNPASG